jgi:predicted phosphodiesterase
MVSFEDRIWKASNLLHRFAYGAFRKQRFASVEGQYDAILKFLRDQNQGMVDCFIYGDTHRAGIYQRKGGPLAVNAGCFTREQGKGSGVETPNTYIFLNEEGLALRQLGRSGSLYLCELL